MYDKGGLDEAERQRRSGLSPRCLSLPPSFPPSSLCVSLGGQTDGWLAGRCPWRPGVLLWGSKDEHRLWTCFSCIKSWLRNSGKLNYNMLQNSSNPVIIRGYFIEECLNSSRSVSFSLSVIFLHIPLGHWCPRPPLALLGMNALRLLHWPTWATMDCPLCGRGPRQEVWLGLCSRAGTGRVDTAARGCTL